MYELYGLPVDDESRMRVTSLMARARYEGVGAIVAVVQDLTGEQIKRDETPIAFIGAALLEARTRMAEYAEMRKCRHPNIVDEKSYLHCHDCGYIETK